MSIDQQVALLNQITQLMCDSTHSQYEELRCEFDYESDQEGWSVGCKFSIVRDGRNVSEFLDDPKNRASGLIHELHELMKGHTGGDWKAFALTVDAVGKAHTKFTYDS